MHNTNSLHGASTGVLMALAAAVLWGTTGTAQSLAPAGLSPLWVGALRLAIAGVFFALLVAWAGRGAWQSLARLSWPHALLAAVCVAAYNLSFFAGVKAVGVGLGTAVAIGSGPIWAGLMQTVLQRRWPTPVWWAGTLLGVAGGTLMALDGAQRMPFDAAGIALCLLAGLAYSSYALLNQQMVRQVHPGAVNLVVFGGAAVLAVAAAAVLAGPWTLSAGAWGVMLYLGVVATGVAYLLFSNALRRISGATGVTLALAEPVTAFGLAIVVVHETPSVLAFLGLAGVLAGLGLVIWSELRSTRRA